ncbi:RidA family protein [Terriglobus roseus]|uniref:2-iminobutanoate/2-iminopropanoate deaminase n=1 Tax=Terriglobus roseus TaxID=392734 RepID=A0A1G7N2C1_9BACT|nr:RidA family protein [Terriglobus roseus]SDF68225.1 2-iminobutanoate/2-iminopropanoate deaminase [Terriglobus roseus]
MAITRRSFATRALALASIPGVDAAPRKRIHRMGPATSAVYSPAVQWGSLLFLSGKGSGTAPDPADIRSCTNHVLDAFAKELANAGSSMENVLKITVYLQRPEDVPAMNEVFAQHFPKDPPARTTIITRTPHPTLVEMDLIAGI